jgi:ABC-type bacteriocin/lantibiotic exporter with double-glycine peptidase domain
MRMDSMVLPEEVAGLSVLFTVLYICKRGSKKRMTKKAKLQAHYLFGMGREKGVKLSGQRKGLLKKWQQQYTKSQEKRKGATQNVMGISPAL